MMRPRVASEVALNMNHVDSMELPLQQSNMAFLFAAFSTRSGVAVKERARNRYCDKSGACGHSGKTRA